MAETGRDLASRRTERRRRLITGVLSGAAHAALLVALVSIRPPASPPPAELDPIPVMLAPPPPAPLPPPEPEPEAEKPKPAPPKKAPPAPKKEPPPPPRVVARVKPAPPQVIPVPAAEKAGYGFTEASEGQVAGAATAESGGGSGSGAGGACNMTRRLQTALRKDRQAQAAMAEAHRGRPILMWNGDWVRHPSQEGAGLAAVREAILWEVGFAPEACKKEPQRGLVLISMNDAPGSARLVVGSGAWRWSDLLFTRGRGRIVRN